MGIGSISTFLKVALESSTSLINGEQGKLKQWRKCSTIYFADQQIYFGVNLDVMICLRAMGQLNGGTDEFSCKFLEEHLRGTLRGNFGCDERPERRLPRTGISTAVSAAVRGSNLEHSGACATMPACELHSAILYKPLSAVPCPPSFQSTIGVAQGLAIVPQVIVKTFFDTLCSPAAQYNPCAPDYAAPWTTNSSTQYIVEEANRYLSAVPGGGALLNDLVEQVTLRTRADSTTVRSVIMRNFSSNGLLVWKGTERASQGTVVSQMGAQLQRLGYTDLEYDYRLTAVPERNDVAALVALDAGNPIILCYPVARGQVDDPMVREAAYFQAAAISPAKSARYVWVSDGAIDFFFDSQTSSVLTALPARPAVAA